MKSQGPAPTFHNRQHLRKMIDQRQLLPSINSELIDFHLEHMRNHIRPRGPEMWQGKWVLWKQSNAWPVCDRMNPMCVLSYQNLSLMYSTRNLKLDFWFLIL